MYTIKRITGSAHTVELWNDVFKICGTDFQTMVDARAAEHLLINVLDYKKELFQRVMCHWSWEDMRTLPEAALDAAQAYLDSFNAVWPTDDWHEVSVTLDGFLVYVDVNMYGNDNGNYATAYPVKKDKLGRRTTDTSKFVKLITPIKYKT